MELVWKLVSGRLYLYCDSRVSFGWPSVRKDELSGQTQHTEGGEADLTVLCCHCGQQSLSLLQSNLQVQNILTPCPDCLDYQEGNKLSHKDKP